MQKHLFVFFFPGVFSIEDGFPQFPISKIYKHLLQSIQCHQNVLTQNCKNKNYFSSISKFILTKKSYIAMKKDQL